MRATRGDLARVADHREGLAPGLAGADPAREDLRRVRSQEPRRRGRRGPAAKKPGRAHQRPSTTPEDRSGSRPSGGSASGSVAAVSRSVASGPSSRTSADSQPAKERRGLLDPMRRARCSRFLGTRSARLAEAQEHLARERRRVARRASAGTRRARGRRLRAPDAGVLRPRSSIASIRPRRSTRLERTRNCTGASRAFRSRAKPSTSASCSVSERRAKFTDDARQIAAAPSLAEIHVAVGARVADGELERGQRRRGARPRRRLGDPLGCEHSPPRPREVAEGAESAIRSHVVPSGRGRCPQQTRGARRDRDHPQERQREPLPEHRVQQPRGRARERPGWRAGAR